MGFLKVQCLVGVSHKIGRGSSGRLLRCHGSQVSMDVAWGSASLLSSHGRVEAAFGISRRRRVDWKRGAQKQPTPLRVGAWKRERPTIPDRTKQ